MQRFVHHLRDRVLVATAALLAGACSTYQPLDRGSDVPWAKAAARWPTEAVAQPAAAGDEGGGRHLVRPGDRLIDLAQHYGVSVAALAESNQLGPPYVIYVGQSLRIPAARHATVADAVARDVEPGAGPSQRRYEVRRGDTLSGIAERFDLPITRLAALNDLGPPYRVFTGQTLTLSDGEATTARRYVSIDTAPPPLSGDGFLWPVNGKVVGEFGPSGMGQRRDGIDIAAPRGAPVLAAENGVVVYAGEGVGSYGRLILLRHDDGYITTYAHNAALLVTVGEVVERGQVVARVGDSGDAERSQLHFELRKGRKPVDPQQYLVGDATEVASAQ